MKPFIQWTVLHWATLNRTEMHDKYRAKIGQIGQKSGKGFHSPTFRLRNDFANAFMPALASCGIA
jgi:hypothetical protein